MLKIGLTILFCWLFFKVIGLAFKAAWGVAKMIATILLVLACPVLVLCLLFAGGLVLCKRSITARLAFPPSI